MRTVGPASDLPVINCNGFCTVADKGVVIQRCNRLFQRHCSGNNFKDRTGFIGCGNYPVGPQLQQRLTPGSLAFLVVRNQAQFLTDRYVPDGKRIVRIKIRVGSHRLDLSIPHIHNDTGSVRSTRICQCRLQCALQITLNYRID